MLRGWYALSHFLLLDGKIEERRRVCNPGTTKMWGEYIGGLGWDTIGREEAGGLIGIWYRDKTAFIVSKIHEFKEFEYFGWGDLLLL